MFKLCKWIILFASVIRLIPHWILFNTCKDRSLIREDIQAWLKAYQKKGYGMQSAFFYFLTFYKDFRNLFYLRIGFAKYFVQFLCRPTGTLFLVNKEIGGGMVLWHAFSTIVHAKAIGQNCVIRQQVTIGNKGERAGGTPVIGNYVEVGAGAIIIGTVTVGDYAVIGAGAVVTKDIPAGCVVVGNPARVIKHVPMGGAGNV